MIIAYDLGTGGLKASLYTARGELRAFEFDAYETRREGALIMEQNPGDWWRAIVAATGGLLQKTGAKPSEIEAVSISGHSLGVAPIDANGALLAEFTPIWSDRRAGKQAAGFFKKFSYKDWYTRTGGGFPPECYSLFKVLWHRENSPELFEKAAVFLGTKDYCNFKFTGEIATDHSYASGCGAYSLLGRKYDAEILEAAGLEKNPFAPVMPSDGVVGVISPEAARQTGLGTHTKVVCGGVDNSCMALGSMGTRAGRVYTSLGSSAWVALTSEKPVLDFKYKPYVFAHLIEGLYVCSTCIFSSGTSLEWLRKMFCENLGYKELDELAAQSPAGARGVIFNPSLAGGSMIEKSPDIAGALAGLKLSTSRADVLRAGLEGIALNLNFALEVLRRYCACADKMLITGGGAKSELWKRIFADVYNMEIITSSVRQEAASLGAAALAMKAIGAIDSYESLDALHALGEPVKPDPETVQKYNGIYAEFRRLAENL